MQLRRIYQRPRYKILLDPGTRLASKLFKEINATKPTPSTLTGTLPSELEDKTKDEVHTIIRLK
jgi:hypothetical protein